MQKLLSLLLAILILVLIGSIIIKPASKQEPTTEGNLSMSPSPAAQAGKQYQQAALVTKKGKSYTAVLHTSAGDITVALSQDTPVTTNNFVFLAQEKFYDGVIFHRVIPGFMIQGGDPTGTGSGGPGYKFADEKFTGEYQRGALAMANAGANTNGSQFFIMHADYGLPKNYVIFGKVTAGMEAVDQIATAPTVQDGRENSRPVSPVKINSIEVIEQ